MSDATEFLVRNGYALLFGSVLAEQSGVPVPAIPLLLAAGALSASGQMSFPVAVGLALSAALAGDTLWYYIGKRGGGRVLNLLCRMSLEPDSCVRRTEESFARRGATSLLYAKFVPGLSTVAPPLAGIFGMPLGRYLLFDGLGTLFWILGYMLVGFAFSDQLERVASFAAGLGSGLFGVLALALAAYLGIKYLQRRRFIRNLRIARIEPVELKRMIDAGEDVVIVDLRASVDFEADPVTIPGSIQMNIRDIEERADAIPRDRDVVLFCT